MARPRLLTPEQARELVQFVARGAKDDALAKRYGVSVATVASIRCGRAYAAETGLTPGIARVGRHRRVSDEQAREILARYREGIPRLRLAREFAVGRYVIDRIVNGCGYTDATGVPPHPSPSPDGIAASRNRERIRRFNGPVECVGCRRRLNRTFASVENSGGVIYCQTCEGRRK